MHPGNKVIRAGMEKLGLKRDKELEKERVQAEGAAKFWGQGRFAVFEGLCL